MATITKGTTPIKFIETTNSSEAFHPMNPDIRGAVIFLSEGSGRGRLIKDGVVYGGTQDVLTQDLVLEYNQNNPSYPNGVQLVSTTFTKGTPTEQVLRVLKDYTVFKTNRLYDNTQQNLQSNINVETKTAIAETKTAIAELKTSLGSALHYRGTVLVPIIGSDWYKAFSENIEVQVGGSRLLKVFNLQQTQDTSCTIINTGTVNSLQIAVSSADDTYAYCEKLEDIDSELHVIDITSLVTIDANSISFSPAALEAWLRGGIRDEFNPGANGDIHAGAFILTNSSGRRLVRLPAPSIGDGNFDTLAKGDIFNSISSFELMGHVYSAGTNVAINKDILSGSTLKEGNIDPLGGTLSGMVSHEELKKMDYQSGQAVIEEIRNQLGLYKPLTDAQKKKLALLADDVVTSDLLTIDILNVANATTANATITKLYNAIVALVSKNSPILFKASNVLVNASNLSNSGKQTLYFIYNGKHYSFEISATSFKWIAKGIDTASGQFINTDVSTIDNLWVETANASTFFGEGEHTVGYALYKGGRKRRCGMLYVMVDHTATFCTQVLITNNLFNEETQTLDWSSAAIGDLNILTRWRRVNGSDTWSKWQYTNALRNLNEKVNAMSNRIIELEKMNTWYTLE